MADDSAIQPYPDDEDPYELARRASLPMAVMPPQQQLSPPPAPPQVGPTAILPPPAPAAPPQANPSAILPPGETPNPSVSQLAAPPPNPKAILGSTALPSPEVAPAPQAPAIAPPGQPGVAPPAIPSAPMDKPALPPAAIAPPQPSAAGAVADDKSLHGWRKALGAASLGAIAFHNPQEAGEQYQNLFVRPQEQANEQLEKARADERAVQAQQVEAGEAAARNTESGARVGLIGAEKAKDEAETAAVGTPKQKDVDPVIIAKVGQRPTIPQYNGTPYADVPAAQKAWSDAYIKEEQAEAAAKAAGDRAPLKAREKAEEDVANAKTPADKAAAQKRLEALDPEGMERIQNERQNHADHEQDVQTARDEKRQAALDKELKPHQDNLDEAQLMHQYIQHPSATNDLALLYGFIGLTKPENLAKIRLNQQELALPLEARSLIGDIDARAQKIQNGQLFPQSQRDMMEKTMALIEAHENHAVGTINDRYQREDIQRGKGTGGGGRQNQGGGAPAPAVNPFRKPKQPQ